MATSSLVLKLRRGSRILNLTSGPYYPGADLNPPSASIVPMLSPGSAANRYGGSEKVSERAQTRTWDLPLWVKGSTEGVIRRGIQALAEFLRSSNSNETLYIDFRPNSDVAAVPLWGTYGSNLSYEVIHAAAPRLQNGYGTANLRGTKVMVVVSCTIAPFAETTQLKLATAGGFVTEDKYGYLYAGSRGLIIAPSGTNKFTNPVFGHSTFSNGWTIGSDLSVTLDTKPHLFGDIGQCVRIVRNTSVGTTTLTQSVTAASTNLQAISGYFAHENDIGTISGVTATYDGLQVPTTWTAVGNGVYRGTAWPTGITSAKNAGWDITVQGIVVYHTASLFEDTGGATAYSATPFFYGEMPGCAWTGTAHASTSTRTAGTLKIDCLTAFNSAEGAVRVIWQPDVSASLVSGDLTLFDNGYIRLTYIAASQYFRFYVNHGSGVFVTSAVQNFIAGNTLVIHCSWGVDSNWAGSYRAITINGVTVSSTATYTVTAVTSNLFIGSTTSGTQQCRGTLKEVATYKATMTSAEMLADYNNLAGIVSNDVCVAPIPYWYSRDGDNITDNALDASGSTGAPHTNWLMAGGIPGTAPAKTYLYGVLSSTFAAIKSVWLNHIPLSQYYDPADFLYYDASGSADVSSSGGSYNSVSVGTTAVTIGGISIVPREGLKEILGLPFFLLARVSDAGSNLLLAALYTIGGTSVETTYTPVTSAAAFRLYKTPQSLFPDEKSLLGGQRVTNNGISVYLKAKRSTGTTNASFDYYALIVGDFARISGSSSGDVAYFYSDGVAGGATTSGTATGDLMGLNTMSLDVIGSRAIEFVPHRLNFLICYSGDDTVDPAIARTITHYGVITPRWEVL